MNAEDIDRRRAFCHDRSLSILQFLEQRYSCLPIQPSLLYACKIENLLILAQCNSLVQSASVGSTFAKTTPKLQIVQLFYELSFPDGEILCQS